MTDRRNRNHGVTQSRCHAVVVSRIHGVTQSRSHSVSRSHGAKQSIDSMAFQNGCVTYICFVCLSVVCIYLYFYLYDCVEVHMYTVQHCAQYIVAACPPLQLLWPRLLNKLQRCTRTCMYRQYCAQCCTVSLIGFVPFIYFIFILAFILSTVCVFGRLRVCLSACLPVC